MADVHTPDPSAHPSPRFAWLRKRTVLIAAVTAALVVALAGASVPALAAIGAGTHAATAGHPHSAAPASKQQKPATGTQSSHGTSPTGSTTSGNTPTGPTGGSGMCQPLRGYVSDCPSCPIASFEPSDNPMCAGCSRLVGAKRGPCIEVAGSGRPQE